jgi:peptide/nickel transport system substrate-binding protein
MKSNARRWIVLLLALTATCVALFSGSSVVTNSPGGFNAGLKREVGSGDTPGGLLRLGSSIPCDSLDPALTFDPWCAVVHRTYSRTLLAFAGKPGDDGLTIVPDLAISAPSSESNNQVWTFQLRSDIFWSDGSPVTSFDMRRAVERMFDDALQSPVPIETLCLFTTCTDGKPDYHGPYVAGSPALTSISTPDATTLIFNLTRSFSDFPNLVATPQFAPIQIVRDDALRAAGSTYASNPASDGPFVITVDTPGSNYSFARNDHWTQASDNIRIPRVDSMSWKVFPDSDGADNALLTGEIDVKLNEGLAPNARDAALADKKQRALIDNPKMGFVNFLLVSPMSAPLDRAPCRDAIFFALDKVDLQRIRGGSATASIAHSMSSPTVLGYDDKFNPYPSGADETGNLKKAKASLSSCGYPDGFQTKMAYLSLGIGQDIFDSVQKSLARVGIVVDPVKYDNFSDYFTNGIGSPENISSQSIGLATAGWGPDFSSSLSYWSPIADGRKIKPSSNQNYAELNNEQINGLLDQLEKTSDPGLIAKLNREIEALVMNESVYLPYAVDQLVLYRPARLTNIYAQLALGGQFDLVNIGKRDEIP